MKKRELARRGLSVMIGEVNPHGKHTRACLFTTVLHLVELDFYMIQTFREIEEEFEAIEFLRERFEDETSRMKSLLIKEVERRCIAEGYCHCKCVRAKRKVTQELDEMAKERRREFHRNFCETPTAKRRAKYHASFCYPLTKGVCGNVRLPDCDCKQGRARRKKKLEDMSSGNVYGP
ncbi:hypothetical protein DM860_004064 [Cuscuta australis]|uniref:Uncharacterized protein n=1 Tax=Cuscuta australis TaxID=267555 RepID=A0A328CV63_9ASTE|nr:hypothetical protein DM860_004064 [Cuscuta australis]